MIKRSLEQMILDKLRRFTNIYIWIWAMGFLYAIVTKKNFSSFCLFHFKVSFSLLFQSRDDFKGIDGMKRKSQNELLLLIALFYVCFQIQLKSLGILLVGSLRRGHIGPKKSEHVEPADEISMIRLDADQASIPSPISNEADIQSTERQRL